MYYEIYLLDLSSAIFLMEAFKYAYNGEPYSPKIGRQGDNQGCDGCGRWSGRDGFGWSKFKNMHQNKFKERFVKRCPCCGCLTIDDTDEVIVDICEICFWQYDEVAQNMPDKIIGPNKVSLNTAKENYKLFGATEECFINMVRPPYEDEI